MICFDNFAKRVFDIIASAAGLLVLFPFLAIITILIRLTSKGAAIFEQTRVGMRGKDFTLYKFRTMAVREGAEKGSFDMGINTRTTTIGRFLRKTKIDEFPQLWNVLRGDMSLVGPRPEIREWVNAYPERWALVHKVKPGITDPASVFYRNEEAILSRAGVPAETYRNEILPHKLDIYEEYVKTRGFLKDIGIIFTTLWRIVFPLKGKIT